MKFRKIGLLKNNEEPGEAFRVYGGESASPSATGGYQLAGGTKEVHPNAGSATIQRKWYNKPE
jgi:hypothetical protein